MRRGLRTTIAYMRRALPTPTPLELPPLPTTPVPMRSPCHTCGHPFGTVARKSQQTVVSCTACGRFQYNAPKREQITWWGQTR